MPSSPAQSCSSSSFDVAPSSGVPGAGNSLMLQLQGKRKAQRQRQPGAQACMQQYGSCRGSTTQQQQAARTAREPRDSLCAWGHGKTHRT